MSTRSQIVKHEETKDGGRELIRLGSDWLPWRYQIVNYVNDGKSYGRPGQKTYHSKANFETEEASYKAFGLL